MFFNNSSNNIYYAIHPVQGCFIGIEYAKEIKALIPENSARTLKSQDILNRYSEARYGKYQLEYQDRKGLLGFRCNTTANMYLMDPRDIALSKELIEEFDVVQSFCIGVFAGLKLVNPISEKFASAQTNKVKHLRLVQ